jgi:hypothetical protein
MRVLAAAAMVCLLAAPLLAAEPVKMGDAKDAQLLQAFLKHVGTLGQRLSPQACQKTADEATENYTWILLPQLSMPLTAYEITADANHLDLFVKVFANMRSAMTQDSAGFWGWYGLPEKGYEDPAHPTMKLDVTINDFRAVELLSRFLELVAADPALTAKYAKQRLEYVDLMENHLVKKWVARGQFVDLGKGGAIQRAHPELKPDSSHLTLPHNKHSIVIHGLLGLYRATGNDEYMKQAVQLGVRFKHSLSLKDGHYEWNYWDPAGAWDVNPAKTNAWKHWIGPEHKGGYYSSTLSQAVLLFQHGVVFDKGDMDRFLKTQMTKCWNGDAADPKWFRVDGTTDKQYAVGEYICPALAIFEAKIGDFLYTGARQDAKLTKLDDWWDAGVGLDGWLRGKYIDLPQGQGGKQVYLQAGQRFLKNKANQDWLKALEFDVTGTGYAPPLTPDKMNPMPPEPPKAAGTGRTTIKA